MKYQKEMVAYARGLGYEPVEDRKKRHLIFRLPGTKVQIVTAATPSDGRAVKNAKADLRRGVRQAAVA